MNKITCVTVQGSYMLDCGDILTFTSPTSVTMDDTGLCTFVCPVTHIDADNHELPGLSVDTFHITSYLPDF